MSLILLCLVMLSLGTSFASDDIAEVAAIDDVAIEEPIAIEEDASLAVDGESSSNVVTNDTIYNYFDEETGIISSNVTSDELIFEGTFENLNFSTLVIQNCDNIKLTGNGAVLNNISLSISSDNVNVTGFTINEYVNPFAISVEGSDVTISNSEINYVDNGEQSSYGINALNSDNFKLLDNVINYVGNSNGYNINNAVYITNSPNSEIRRNKINASLVSAPVGWEEVPAGSNNWQPTLVISEGVSIEDSEDVVFSENVVNVVYNKVSGAYDTIYSVSVKDSKNIVVSNNDINSLGHTYIYGIQITGENFTIEENNIITETDNYYANGIDIEGPATGIVKDNVIEAVGVESAYAIYSGMNGADVSANYTGNNVSANAYNVFGFSLGDVESHLNDNYIDLTGNYTTGVAYRGSNIDATGNKIVLTSSEEGNLSVWEGFGVEAVGIKVIKGNAILTNNTIATAGKGVSLTGNETSSFLTGNIINVVGNDDKDAYAVYAKDVGQIYIVGNEFDYQGATKSVGINNALYIDNATSPMIALNKFDLDLVSSYVPWAEVPAGSGNWVSSPVSEGIVIANSEDISFEGNDVNVVYGDVVGSYDTIYAVDVRGSNNAVIAANKINAKGHTYIYGIIVSGENFTIEENNITSESDNYYANGIDVEGPAYGIIDSNYINVTGVESSYGIYSGMNGQSVATVISNNTIEGDAYNVFGMSLGDDDSIIANNDVFLKGNYTTGIASKVANLIVDGNNIELLSFEQGNLTVWESFGVESAGIKIVDGNASITKNYILAQGKGVSLIVGSALVVDNNITVVANEDADAYAIYAKDLLALGVINNTVLYVGATEGQGINNALYISNTPVAAVHGNEFNLSLISSYVPWAEVPAGSGNWVSSPVSEGIVIESSLGIDFSRNTVNVIYSDVVGSYDTIYAVSIKDSDVAYIYGNKISALGHTYIYGIQMSGDGFIMANNTIKVESDNYYANGIDIEGPASGVVINNKVEAAGVESAYCIYSGMNGQNATVDYSENILKGEAYNVFGMSLGDVEAFIKENEIALKGNYTTGIAYRGSNLIARENVILAEGSNVGNLSVWEAFGVENIGVKVVAGESQIINNEILTSGDYAVDVRNNTALVCDNFLKGAKYVGDESVANATNAEVYNNTPSRLQSIISITEVSGDLSIVGVLKDVEGNVIADAELVYSFNGTNYTVKTDDKGIFELNNLTNGEINMSFDGATLYKPYNTTITLKDIAPSIVKVESNFNITGGVITLNGYAVDTKAGEEGIYYATELLDANGNPIKGAKIQFAVNDKIYNRTTNENGSFNPYKLNMVRAGRYTMAFYFAGNDNYTGAFASVCVDLDKKPIKIKASAKSYKAATKTKKYTVTLSTKVCSSHDGKAHLRTGLKVTLTVNGKTFTGKTNSKGQVTFKITNLSKKAKYKAKVSYEGDATYDSASKTVTLTVN